MSLIWNIVIAIDSIAFIAFLLFVFVYKRKFAGIKHFEKIRDKLTLRKQKKYTYLDNSTNATGTALSSISFGNLLGAFVLIIVGTSLIPFIVGVSNSVNQEQISNVSQPGMTNSAQQILNIMPIIFIFFIAIASISLVANSFRRLGFL